MLRETFATVVAAGGCFFACVSCGDGDRGALGDGGVVSQDAAEARGDEPSGPGDREPADLAIPEDRAGVLDADLVADESALDPGLDGADIAPDQASDVRSEDAADRADLPELDRGPSPPPPRARVTVNAVPDSMNGAIPYAQNGGPPQSFHLRVPTGGFTVEVYRDDGVAPGPDRVRLFASAPVRAGAEVLDPGTDIAPALGCGLVPDPMAGSSDRALVARCLVPEAAFEVASSVTLTALLEGPDGTAGEPDAVTVEVAELVPWLDPFETPDVWLVTLSRDLCDHELIARPDGTYDILTTFSPSGDGTPDLDEALAVLGLLSDDVAFSQAARALFLARVRAYSNQIFGLDDDGHPTAWGVPLHLYFEGDAGAPDPSTWSEQAGFSMIAMGGDPKPADIASGIVGRAWIDWNNQGVEDNTILDFGVFVTNIVRQAMRNPLGALILHEISPLDGTPLGEYPGDEQFLNPNFDPSTGGDPRLEQRHAIFTTIMDFATLAVAATLCHEMGHSLGLVPDGPPPEGLFGGMDGLSFTDSDAGSAHIDTPGLNVMQTGKVTSYLEALGGVPRFNELNLAYLRRRLVVGRGEGRSSWRVSEPVACAWPCGESGPFTAPGP